MTAGVPPVILVPLDGSALAEGALWVAARAARRLRAVLHVVTVIAPDDDAEAPHPRQHDLQHYLAAKADELATSHGTSSSSAVLHGWPPEALAAYARTSRCSLVIMTAHGRSGVNRSWIGSVTESLLARTPAPVLVLRPGLCPPHDRFDHILVALDGSAGSATVLAQAVALGSLGGAAEYTLVRVTEPLAPAHHGSIPSEPETREAFDRRQTSAALSLERAAVRLRNRGVATSTRVLVAESVAECLLEAAGAMGSDLIVVGTQRAHAPGRLVLGSVADKVVRGGRQPVLVVPVRRASPIAPRRRRRAQRKKGQPA